MGYGITIRARGPYALFTRPEMKVERVSYDVITPSAARGIIEASSPYESAPVTVSNPVTIQATSSHPGLPS